MKEYGPNAFESASSKIGPRGSIYRRRQEIRCRGKLSDGCYEVEGLGIYDVYEDFDAYKTDRTYDPKDDSVVCNSCYLLLPNRGLFDTFEELDALIEGVRNR